ncbi:DUF6233 domain-containing protein [Streptomyces sp. NBC_01353]|uniref:DUF6233 domain-containing protein n=1 Tax=Streptomyces sp. NBC_01353 TaxID=2903835 RepID=UPI002E33C0F6|nr:DUF6233 domain-containing protein [Streptomyces sp. NBC_01353]
MSPLSISQRLEKKRTVLVWLQWQTEQTAKEIRQLEAEEKEEQRRRDVARAEMSWKIMPSRAAEGQPMLHRGGCHIDPRQTGLLSQDEVFVALREFPAMEMCEICNVIHSLAQFGIEKPAPRKLPGGGKP